MAQEQSFDKLQQASEFLAYEIWMFYSIADIFIKQLPIADNIIKNALIESFVIHLRNLIDFFYNDKPKSDDITVINFVNANCIPEITEKIKLARKRAHKEVAHLTLKRTFKSEDKQWDIIDLKKEFKLLIDIFVKNMNNSLITGRWYELDLINQHEKQCSID